MPKTVGILLAGGSGSRLSPLTNYISKHLLPVFDKPMIYYSLSVLLLAGVKEVLLITNPENVQNYKKLFGNGSQLGIKILYFIQKKPNGIPEAFNICKESIKNKDIYLILADNIFYGNNFQKILNTKNKKPGCTIFTHSSKNSKSYGVLKLDKKNKPYKIYEKPKKYISDKIVTGLYFYKGDIFKYLNKLKKSSRGELEITDLNNIFIKNNKLNYIELGRGFTWIDAGTPERLMKSSNIIANIEKQSSFKIGLPEEISLRKGFISKEQFKILLSKNPNPSQRKYLKKFL